MSLLCWIGADSETCHGLVQTGGAPGTSATSQRLRARLEQPVTPCEPAAEAEHLKSEANVSALHCSGQALLRSVTLLNGSYLDLRSSKIPARLSGAQTHRRRPMASVAQVLSTEGPGLGRRPTLAQELPKGRLSHVANPPGAELQNPRTGETPSQSERPRAPSGRYKLYRPFCDRGAPKNEGRQLKNWWRAANSPRIRQAAWQRGRFSELRQASQRHAVAHQGGAR